MAHQGRAAAPATIRSLGLTVYLPTLVFGIGQGAVLPIVALVAKDLGASVAVAGLVVAVRGIGTLLFDIPAGALISRLGEKRAMVIATLMLIASNAGAALSSTVVALALFMLLMGCGWSVWLLARLAYVTDVMPLHLRGRALSTLGGTMRIGNFAGPFIGAVVISLWGLDATYWVHLVLAVVGLVLLVTVNDPHAEALAADTHAPASFRAVGRAHAHVWRTAGFGALCIGLLRASRPAILPLWATHVGVDAAGVSLIFGFSSAMDMTLFYPAGFVSDRFGRKFVAVPCITLLATGFLLLPLTNSFATVCVVGLLIGFGNGLGAGIVMTLGSDFAPSAGKAEFLGLWRLIGDIGTAGGPLVVAAVVAATGLGPAAIVVAAVGYAGAGVVLTRMPEPAGRANRVADDRSSGYALRATAD